MGMFNVHLAYISLFQMAQKDPHLRCDDHRFRFRFTRDRRRGGDYG